MEMPGAIAITIDMKPRTGGSGGGGPNKNLWPHPEPAGILGLNSVVVYGTNFQVACPLNIQLALGSNVQLCINPTAFKTLYSDDDPPLPETPTLAAFLGSGLGGNMQMTMGTSANFVMGQIFDINLGPARMTIDVHTKSGIQDVCKTIGTAIIIGTAVFVLGLYLIPDDDSRMAFVVLFQLLAQVTLLTLMNLQTLYKAMDDTGKKALCELYGHKFDNPNEKAAFEKSFADQGKGWVGPFAAVMVMVVPMLMDAIGEIVLKSQPTQYVQDATTGQDVLDSAGNKETAN